MFLSWILSAKKQKSLLQHYELRTSLGQSKLMTLKADIMSYLRFYIKDKLFNQEKAVLEKIYYTE